MNSESKNHIVGHCGLVGTALVRNLRVKGFDNFVIRTYAELDLFNQATKNRVAANCDHLGNEETARGTL